MARMPGIPKEYIAERCVIAASGCWVWTGSIGTWGYGAAKNGRHAHRCAYEAWNGPIPPGLRVLHRCDNRACVNPEHLFAGTQAENIADMADKRRGPVTVKLTAAHVAEIRAALEGGERQADIAARYGVTKTAICNIAHGRTWRR